MSLRVFLLARHPAQLIVGAFALAAFAGGGILALPVATVDSGGAGFLTALFTSVSSICVTGLIVVDTATYWSEFGQAVIMILIQIGGLGIMTLTSLLVFLVAKRLGLRGRLIAQAETSATALSDVRRLVYGVVILSFVFEAIAATVLFVRFLTGYDYSFGQALWHAVFHAITSFNNAGFALYSDNLVGFVTDGWVSVTISLSVIAGGLGFPVWLELFRVHSPKRWTLHTKLTLLVTGFLLALGTIAILGFEWSNDGTLGPLSVPGKLLAAFFQGVEPRTAGFNTVDTGDMGFESLLVTDVLMFIGTGSGSTGGGIKVTTLALLALMVWAEVRGEPSVNAFGRRIPETVQRQAFTVAFIALNAVVVGTLVLMATSDFALSQALFEALSAFGTVGLSTGITGDLGTAGQWVLISLMYLGRVGPHTLGVALALKERERHYRFPEDRPIIG